MNTIKDSIISEKAVLYSNIRCVRCLISDDCHIGDDSDLVDSNMDSKTELGRRNLIRDVTIGTGSYTGTNTIIKHTDIGKYCCISWNVSIGGGNHDYNHASMYTQYWYKRTFGVDIEEQRENKKVKIGNDVWIGSNVTILSGISIDDGAVIGAGAVVTKDVPAYAVVVGVPAKVIKYRFSQEIINGLKEIKWWDWPIEKIKDSCNLLSKPLNESILEKLKEMAVNENY